MAKLNLQQQHLIAKIEVLTDDISTARRIIKKQIEEEFERRVEDLKRNRSRAANEALAAGIPKRHISLALGTSNWDTLNATLAMTAAEFTPEAIAKVEPKAPWEYDPETMVLTLHQYVDRLTDQMVVGERKVQYRFGPDGRTFQSVSVPEDVFGSWAIGLVEELARGAAAPAPAEEEDEDAESIAAQLWAQPSADDENEDW